jgi:hypothetical protein
MATHVHPSAHRHAGIRIVGHPVSDSATHLLKQLAADAHVHTIYITSVHRSVVDQARIFYQKHIVERKAAYYKNPAVSKIIAHARDLHRQGSAPDRVKAYLFDAIDHVHGGPQSVSSHIGVHIFTEVFDVAHYKGPISGHDRHDYMTKEQARSFLVACRKRMPSIISRLGRSSELGFVLPTEFHDEKCFHFEVKQLLYDKLEQTPTTMIA